MDIKDVVNIDPERMSGVGVSLEHAFPIITCLNILRVARHLMSFSTSFQPYLANRRLRRSNYLKNHY